MRTGQTRTRPRNAEPQDQRDRRRRAAKQAAAKSAAGKIVDTWLKTRTSPHTARAYRGDLETYRRHRGRPTVAAAVAELLAMDVHRAAEAADLYVAWQRGEGYALASVYRRTAALKSLCRMANRHGRIAWRLDVRTGRATPIRDTRGPGEHAFDRMLAGARQFQTPQAARDTAALHLLHDIGLRRAEAAALTVADVDLAGGTNGWRLWITGKGKCEREEMQLPEPTAAALQAWMRARGDRPGPLLLGYDHRRQGRDVPQRGLTPGAVGEIVRRISTAAGCRCTAHGLRHTAITTALEATGGDLRKVARFSRHKDWNTLALYDDARRRTAGDVADLVARAG